MSETSPITEQANPETELARDRYSPEDLPHDALQTIPRTEPVVQVLEQSNVELENFSVGAGRTKMEEEEDMLNNTGRVVQPGAGGSSSGGLRHNGSETRGAPLVDGSTMVVGLEYNTNEIWSWLMDYEVSTIGIYGKGGAGKTILLLMIYNTLLQRPNISHHVYWVTLSRDFSIYNLQNIIAKRLDLDLSSEYDILPRAVKLSKELMKKQKWILILDDLWNSFELHEVGIPIPLKGCKLIITTRSEAVCRQMSGRNNVRVNPLSRDEARSLFMLELGHDRPLSPEVERIAAYIARECADFPLGIITLARSLRVLDDEHECRNALNKLKELKSRDKVDDVFWMLRFSYDRLDDVALNQCLLYCALYPESHEIEREELIGYLILERIIEKKWSREAAFDKGHAMLDRLENAGFLQRIDGGRAVKMHDLVRDMAIRICQENPSVMGQRRKGKEMAGSNIDRLWNHVEQMNDGGNSTHKTLGKRRKRIEMAPLKSGWTGAVSASAQEQNNVDMAQQQEPLLTGEFEQAIDLTGGGIELPRDAPDDQDELKKGSKYRDMVDYFKSGWTLLMTSLILEIASAVFDQLGNALVGMVLAYVALPLATAELIYMERMARRESRSLLPISHRPSPWKPAGTIVEYFGLVGAVWQCVYSTMEYNSASQKKENPIKMSLLPSIFLLCVVISKLIKKSHIDKSA